VRQPQEGCSAHWCSGVHGGWGWGGAGAGIGAVGAGVYAGVGWAGRAEGGQVAPVGSTGNAVEMLRVHGGGDGGDDGDGGDADD
jgi:hypothetical protein